MKKHMDPLANWIDHSILGSPHKINTGLGFVEKDVREHPSRKLSWGLGWGFPYFGVVLLHQAIKGKVGEY